MGASVAGRAVTARTDVAAPLEEVWQAWTTEEGVRTFFAPAARVDLRPGGAYEMLFDLEADPGRQGGEGNRLMAIQPQRLLSFSWNAPPELAEVREQRTHVSVWFTALAPRRTRVSLRHDGWGEGEEWDRAYAYFERAWGRVVLPRLRYRFAHGPVDWDHIPDL